MSPMSNNNSSNSSVARYFDTMDYGPAPEKIGRAHV